MILIDKMKNLKIYRTPTFLPTLANNKKKNSAILLMTPNKESSYKLMNSNLFINKLRYQSYFLSQDVSYYINSKSEVLEESIDERINIYNNESSVYNIEKEFGVYSKENDAYNACVKVKGIKEILRARSEILVVDNDKVFVKFTNDEWRYELPGGSWDQGEKSEESAMREAREECRLEVSDVKFFGSHITIEDEVADWVKENIDEKDWWQGYYTDVFIGRYAGEYTGDIREEDKDEQMSKGKWYKIKDVYSKLNEIHQRALDSYVNESTIVQEKYLLNEKDIYYNKDKFDSGEINLCFITGHSGSGKTTMASDMSNEKDVEMYELDDILVNWIFSDEELKEYGDLIYSFFKGTGKKYRYYSYEEWNNDKTWDKMDFTSSIIKDFVNYTKSYSSSHKNTKFVIEGIWIFKYLEPKELDKYAVYIKGTSALVSDIRGTKRDAQDAKTLPKKIASSISRVTKTAKNYYLNEKIIKKYRDYFSERINEFAVINRHILDLKNGCLLDGNPVDINKSDEYCPVNLSNIPNYMGINLSSVDSVEWSELPDGQLVDIVVKFIPDNRENDKVQEVSILEACKDWLDTMQESMLKEVDSPVLNLGNQVIFFNESSKDDTQLRRLLYNDRLRKRKDILLLYDEVKSSNPWIKYTFPDFTKYKSRNVFIDLSYYNNLFFNNNTWVREKGMNLFLEYMKRAMNLPFLTSNGYKKKTIFIPIIDWTINYNHIWDFRKSLNPMSVLYYLMNTNKERLIKDTFGDTDIIFIGPSNYFKLNFSQVDFKDIKKYALKFKSFLIKICKNEEFEYEDIDTSSENVDSPEAIKAKIADKIEIAKGVDITGKLNNKKDEPKEEENNISKNAKASKTISKQKDKKEKDIEKIVDTINNGIENNKTEEEIMNSLNDDELKDIIMNLDSGVEKPIVDQARAKRMTELDNQLLKQKVGNRTIDEILNNDKDSSSELPKTELNISSPNEDWKNVSYMNFNKNYDIDKDIVSCFRHFSTVSRPFSIRNITVENNSTSEDRVNLYKVEVEDYRGKRFTIKLDIPIMVDNRFLLRGNYKSISNQIINMPITKIEQDACQIVSNYMKIIVKRFGATGKSLPETARFLKACNKYKGRKLKFTKGNNSKACIGYCLPIDYVDISRELSRIESDDFIIYFNQDEIRKNHSVEENKGIPYMYTKKDKIIHYFDLNNTMITFTEALINYLEKPEYKDFIELFQSATSPTICAYSRCSIMNSKIPLVVICGYHEGLRNTLKKAHIEFEIKMRLDKEDRNSTVKDYIKFKNGYLVYFSSYSSSMLMNGLKACSTDLYELADMDRKDMYLDFLDNFGGKIKADGLDNFYDLMIDPKTKEILEICNLPTDYVQVLIYANNLLADNDYISHVDQSSKRVRRYEIISAYTYKVLADAYCQYANKLKHSGTADFFIKQSAVIDRFLTDSITSDDSCINALRDLETTNAASAKGPSGMNTDRAYSMEKRSYDESMSNIFGLSTGFGPNSGVTRQFTIDANVYDDNGFVKQTNGDTSKMNTVKSLTATEALTPFGSTRDDPARTAMTFIQTAKHMVRTEESDPLLVTNGIDEAMPYLSSDKFAFKAKEDGKVIDVNEDYMIIEYKSGNKDYKVNSRFKKDDILAYDEYSYSNCVGESDNLAYNIGKLAKVAIINTDDGFEDSGIITEKMAKYLGTKVDLESDITLDAESNVLSMVKIGDYVQPGDNLVVWSAPFEEEDANTLMKILSKDTDVSELGKRTLKSRVTGIVKDIKIYRTVDVDQLSDSLKKIVTNYEKPLIQLEKKLKANNIDISNIPAHYKLPTIGKLKNAENSIKIVIYVEYLDTVGIGDKIVYFAANKAVEKSIIPKGKEPYTDFRPNEQIDAFVTETSIDRRIVTSTLITGSLQKLMIELDRSIKDIMEIPYDDSEV